MLKCNYHYSRRVFVGALLTLLGLFVIPGTLQSMAAPSKVISVKDYGAIRDGVTDDRLNIQAVIDSLSAAGGGTLEVPAGTYLLNSYSHILHPGSSIT